MFSLDKLEIDQKARVVKVHAKEQLKHRLISFGITKGATITLLGMCMTKSTLNIRVDGTKVALRKSEAMLIEVAIDE